MKQMFCISNEMKNKILNFSYEQMLEVEHDLNEWKWNDLLGDKPEGFDELHNYPHTWYQERYWYKKLFNYKTKHDYVHPIRKYILQFTNVRDELYYHNVIVRKTMNEDEFQKFWIDSCLNHRNLLEG